VKKKQFKMLLASNPYLEKWFMENRFWLQTKPEVMLYIVHHPQVLSQFKPGQPIDQNRLWNQASMYVNQLTEQKQSKKLNKKKTETNETALPQKKKKKSGLFSNIKSKFSQLTGSAVAPTSTTLPAIKRPQVRNPFQKHTQHSLQKAQVTRQKRSFPLPKIKLSRRKVMDTMSQTVEMLDVVSALMGRMGNMK
jgi:hypothetical protein